MTESSFDDKEAPLDPAMERIQRKLRRLMLVGGGTLTIGLLAVLGAILYRSTKAETRLSTIPTFAEATIPAGARLVSTTVTGDRTVLGFAVGQETLILMVDSRTLKVIGQLRLKAN